MILGDETFSYIKVSGQQQLKTKRALVWVHFNISFQVIWDQHHLSIISASLCEVHWFQPFYTLKNSWMDLIWYVNFVLYTSLYRLFWRGWTEKKIFSCFFFLQYYPFKVFSLLSLLCLSSLYYHRNTLTNICVSTKDKHDPFFSSVSSLFSLRLFLRAFQELVISNSHNVLVFVQVCLTARWRERHLRR